jgi:hypothetical protein
MMVILLMILLKVALTSCSFKAVEDKSFGGAFYTLFLEVVLLALGTALIQGLSFYGALTLSQDYTYCIFLAIILWTTLGMALITSQGR